MKLNIIDAPVEVQVAFNHVRELFPEVTSVTYDELCRWEYNTDQVFTNVDQQILELAADAQYNIRVPVTYSLM